MTTAGQVERIFREEQWKPAPYRDYGTDQFYIFALAKHYESETDVKLLTEMNYYNPKLSLLDEKINASAQLLRSMEKIFWQVATGLTGAKTG